MQFSYSTGAYAGYLITSQAGAASRVRDGQRPYLAIHPRGYFVHLEVFYCFGRFLCLSEPRPFMKGPIGDALELVCDFCPRKAVSSAGELFLDVLPKTVQGALKKMDTAICECCQKTQMAKLAA